MRDEQLALFEGRMRRDFAIEKVAVGASPKWLTEATRAIYHVARHRLEFTTDDVWTLLERRGIAPPREPRAMGAAMRKLALTGAIRPTERTEQSHRPECHARDVRIWRSHLMGETHDPR